MHEIELIRAQLRLERQHACESAARLAASARAGAAIHAPEIEYLMSAFARFEVRDQRLLELARGSRLKNQPSPSLTEVLAGEGATHDARARLEHALPRNLAAPETARRWQELHDYCTGPWRSRREAIESYLTEHASVEEWRAVCALDADSVLEERTRFARLGGARAPSKA